MTSIAANLQGVKHRIARAADAAERNADDIVLVAVSKTFPAERIAEACAAGQRAFGENHAQEAVKKITLLGGPTFEWRTARTRQENGRARSDTPIPSSGVAFPSPHSFPLSQKERGSSSLPSPLGRRVGDEGSGPLRLPLEWHFIGPIQSNKTRLIAAHFQWVHSVEREKIALRLNEARPQELPPLDVCIQVNISGEGSKSGVAPGAEAKLAEAIARLPRLRLRGLMALPEPTPDVSVQRRRFALLRELQEKLAARGFALDTLSMGMSDDLEAAILEGATMVRVGTAIFGPRPR
jgi:PLP dependent protein